MSPRLPPPDPHESLGMEPPNPGGPPTTAVVYVRGAPSPSDDRVAEAIVRTRPGVLIVVAPG
jgi:hypothetical protein